MTIAVSVYMLERNFLFRYLYRSFGFVLVLFVFIYATCLCGLTFFNLANEREKHKALNETEQRWKVCGNENRCKRQKE